MHRWLVPGADCRQYPLLFAIGITFFGAGVGTLVYALRTGNSAVRLAALRATRRSLRHGVSRFEMARVRIEVGRLEVRRSWLGLGWTRSLPAADVAGRHIRSKREAERLAFEMKRAIGVRDPVSSSSGPGDPVPAGAPGSGRSDA